MKKVMILALVLMLVVVTVAAAGIRFSKHDMSSSGGQNTRSTNQDDLCVFCHTPHGSNLTMTAAPLWNRTQNQSNWNTNSAYSSTTLNGTPTGPYNSNAISMACLSCHDGNTGGETLVNGPGSGTASTVNWQNSSFNTIANLNDTAGLTNDHPIGVAFPNAADLGLYGSVLNTNITTPGSTVQCSSCHDVHNPAIIPFLVMSNSGSAMCLACHNK